MSFIVYPGCDKESQNEFIIICIIFISYPFHESSNYYDSTSAYSVLNTTSVFLLGSTSGETKMTGQIINHVKIKSHRCAWHVGYVAI